MNSFSQRKGLKPIKSILQVDSMDDDLRNGLWNALQACSWSFETFSLVSSHAGLSTLLHSIWREFYKQPVDEIDAIWSNNHKVIKKWFFKAAWNEVYDFLEFVVNNSPTQLYPQRLTEFCNEVLEREMSAYRFVNGLLVPLTSKEEIAAVEQALSAPAPLKPVTTHLETALAFLSDKTNPDYRNSIKESISAVESMCNLITGGKDTLGDALKKVEGKLGIHAALKKGFSSIYGYTNDASGIRHALLDEPNLDFEDAKYMLVACSAFINYLASKAIKAGVKF